MRGSSDFGAGNRLAMAGRKSPWGDGNGTTDEAPPVAGDDAPPIPDEPEGKQAPGEAPRNPWLPTSDSDPTRRSANIEDILRQRGLRSPGSGRGGSGRNWLPVVLAGLVAAWAGGTSVHILGKGEQGLVTTLGRFDRSVGPGLTMTLPWPIQAVTARNTAKIEETVLPAVDGENLMLTRDHQLLDVSAKLRWRVADLRRFNYGATDSEALIARLADAEVHAAVAEQRFEGLIDGRSRGELQQQVARRTQAALDALKVGVRVEGVEVVRANAPARLSESFRKVREASDAARKKVGEAQAFSQTTLQNAAIEASDFDRVYAQYQVAPEITRKRRYYETMERVLSNGNRVVIGNAGVNVGNPPAPQASGGTASSTPTPAGGQ